ncbi:MAG: UDP-N-acetylmuramoyl-tripeptide--D-alanyl-D-alanine ligase [Candidatus Neomarinimicrobiota bacterium]
MRVDLPDPVEFAALFAAVTGQTLERTVSGIATDSRECRPSDLFVAIRGEQVDGHRFLAAVDSAGSAAALVQRPDPDLSSFRQVAVADPVRTIGDIARQWRQRFTIPLIGITGSNGKTTTKELLSHIFSADRSVHATRGNYNTSVGLPLTLLTLTAKHRLSILEMGANRPGDIALLAEIAEPTHGLITNIAPAHLEGFGSIEMVARTKGELFAALAAGTAFVNRSDERVAALPLAGQAISFGFRPDCDYSADLHVAPDGYIQLTINTNELDTGYNNPTFARNTLAAVAVADTLGLDWPTIQARIKTFRQPPGRCEVKQLKNITVIDDSYNANLVSVSAAIDFLRSYHADGRHIMVFADMLELGTESRNLHIQVGEIASAAGLDAIFTFGPAARHTDEALTNTADHRHFDDKAILAGALKDYLRSGDVVLFKGSRGMALETIIAELREL